jgi:NADH oxidase (H2O2-forming)
MSAPQRIVVIGCSGAGALAAMTLKKMEPALEVTILREPDEEGLLTRCATPYICCGNVMVEPSYKDDAMFTDQNIRLVNSKAEKLDRSRKEVTTTEGNTYPYDVLVLATGAIPLLPRVSGIELPGVFALRKSGDAVNILNWLNTKRVRAAVLLGAGPIGVEIAYLAARHGIRIYVIEMLEHVLPKAFDSDMVEDVEAYMQSHNVELRLKQRLKGIMGDDAVKSVVLSSGEQIEAQMALISVGVKPNIALAEQAGLTLGRLGVHVNKHLRTSDPNIYAGGDLIEYPHWVTGKQTLGQLRPNAVIAGRVIARNILGGNIEYPGFINSFATKFFDKSMAGTGLTEQQAITEGLDVASAKQSSDSMHSMMRGRKPYTVKLVFDKTNGGIIGGQVVSDSDGPVKHIDAITAAIRGKLTALDLATLRCAGQPELSPDPGREPMALAAGQAYDMMHG